MKYLSWVIMAVLALAIAGNKIAAFIASTQGVIAIVALLVVAVVAIAFGVGFTFSHNAIGKDATVVHNSYVENNFFNDDNEPGEIRWIRRDKND